MSRPIQVIPPGLLGFLQLKNNGQAPAELPDTLQAVLEMRDWYMEANYETSIATVAVAPGGVGFTSFTTPGVIAVPAGEYWFVKDYTVHLSTSLAAATDIVSFVAAWGITIGAQFAQFMVGIPQPLLAGSVSTRSAMAGGAGGFFAPPGAEFGFRSLANEAAGNLTYQGQIRFTRLKI